MTIGELNAEIRKLRWTHHIDMMGDEDSPVEHNYSIDLEGNFTRDQLLVIAGLMTAATLR